MSSLNMQKIAQSMLLIEFALVTANSRTFCSLWRKRQGVCARPWISTTCSIAY